MQFPSLDTRTLQGTDKRLPGDLPAERTLILLPFQRWQQRQVDAWIGRATDAGWAADLTAQQGDLTHAVLEIPCISRRWALGRGFIDGGMSAGIRIPEVLARTWTAYTDVGRVQRALDISDSAQTWVGVVERTGAVLAHTAGDPTEGSWPPIAEAMA